MLQLRHIGSTIHIPCRHRWIAVTPSRYFTIDSELLPRLIENCVGSLRIPFVWKYSRDGNIRLPVGVFTATQIQPSRHVFDLPMAFSILDPSMMGQIQLVFKSGSFDFISSWFESQKCGFSQILNDAIPSHTHRPTDSVPGRGYSVEPATLSLRPLSEDMAVITFVLRTGNAMGPNHVIKAAQRLKSYCAEQLATVGVSVGMAINSNNGDGRIVEFGKMFDSQLLSRLSLALSMDYRAQVAAHHFCSVGIDHPLPVVTGTVGRPTKSPLTQYVLDVVLDGQIPIDVPHLDQVIASAVINYSPGVIPDPAPIDSLWPDGGEITSVNRIEFRGGSVLDRRRMLGWTPTQHRPPQDMSIDGYFDIPMGVVPNVVIDGVLRHVALAVEEPSVVAAASKASKCIGTYSEFSTVLVSESDTTEIKMSVQIPHDAVLEMMGFHSERTDAIDHFLNGYRFSVLDPSRAITSNKGFDNMFSSVLLAAGIDPFPLSEAYYTQYQFGHVPFVKWSLSDDSLIVTCRFKFSSHIVNETEFSCPEHDEVRRSGGAIRPTDIIVNAVAMGLAGNFAAISALMSVVGLDGHFKLHENGNSKIN